MKTKKPAGRSKSLSAPDAEKSAAVMKEIFPDVNLTPAKAIEKPRGQLLNDPDDRRDLFSSTRSGLRALAAELEGEDDFLMQQNVNRDRFFYTRMAQFKKILLALCRIVLDG
jgi:hypothetical protein